MKRKFLVMGLLACGVLLAGAEFIVAPTLNLDVIRLCRRYDKLVMPGAFTPTCSKQHLPSFMANFAAVA